jgi:hypothetical protein
VRRREFPLEPLSDELHAAMSRNGDTEVKQDNSGYEAFNLARSVAKSKPSFSTHLLVSSF